MEFMYQKRKYSWRSSEVIGTYGAEICGRDYSDTKNWNKYKSNITKIPLVLIIHVLLMIV